MALTPHYTNLAANTAADAICVLLNSGKLNIYSGTIAATADTAIGAQVLLAQLTFGSAAFGASVAGVATANAITSDSSADATGTATWFRALKTDGTTAVFDGSVGTATSNLVLDSVSIVAAGTVACTAFSYTFPKT